jgi:hypothetical protein
MLEGLQLDEDVLSVMMEDNDRRLEVGASWDAVLGARSFRDDRVRLVKAVEAERKLSVRSKAMVACTVVCAACIKGPAAGGDLPPVEHSTSFSAIDIGGPPEERLASEGLFARARSPHAAIPYALVGLDAPDQAKHAEARNLDWFPTFEDSNPHRLFGRVRTSNGLHEVSELTEGGPAAQTDPATEQKLTSKADGEVMAKPADASYVGRVGYRQSWGSHAEVRAAYRQYMGSHAEARAARAGLPLGASYLDAKWGVAEPHDDEYDDMPGLEVVTPCTVVVHARAWARSGRSPVTGEGEYSRKVWTPQSNKRGIADGHQGAPLSDNQGAPAAAAAAATSPAVASPVAVSSRQDDQGHEADEEDEENDEQEQEQEQEAVARDETNPDKPTALPIFDFAAALSRLDPLSSGKTRVLMRQEQTPRTRIAWTQSRFRR